MSGPSDSSTVGGESRTATEQMAIGWRGEPRVLGCFERDLARILSQNGIPEESMQVIVQQTTHCVRVLLQASLESYILATQAWLIEPKKPESTSTSESQNEEVG
ncbi:hypothetical protein LCGC14_1553270 [marine sediment metagenome]|uniref:Uncharacterized protein n=1 Tax=marine sediment metagenome TaxID=412755 RepID=A0A0F9JAR1_9ZZZZ